MDVFQLVVLSLCFIFLAIFLFPVLREWRKQNHSAKEKENGTLQRIKEIDALAVPVSVMARAELLLREKGVRLDAQLEQYMVEGFKDYLIGVLYSRRDGSAPAGQGVAMTSDTVDTLWHAWLEDGQYEDTFVRLLGFPLVHVPEAPELVASQRGPGNIDFLVQQPHARAVATYRTLKAALPAVGRQVHCSALYLLDSLAGNPEGFYYSGAILGALGRVPPGSLGKRAAGGACGTSCSVSGDGGNCLGHGCGTACASGSACSGGH